MPKQLYKTKKGSTKEKEYIDYSYKTRPNPEKNTSMDWQFENPLAGCDFATGKYFNRLEVYWESEYLRKSTAGSKGTPKIGDYETAKRAILKSRMKSNKIDD